MKIDKELPLDEAALFGCAVLTGVGAVINTAKVPAGSSVAVVGLGGVGLSSLLGAVAVGARRVVAIDLSDDKLGLARQLGATDTFNPAAAQTRSKRSRPPPAAASSSRSRWPDRCARWTLPTRSRAAAARR